MMRWVEKYAYKICAMRIKLASVIISCKVEQCLIKERDNLQIGRCAQELNSLDRSGGDNTRATTRLGTPGRPLRGIRLLRPPCQRW